MTNWIVVLAGGVGSRFWPLSTPARPKQLLPLVGARALLRETIDRLLPLADPAHILVLTNSSLVEPIEELLPEVPSSNLIAEPRPAGTAAALTWAAAEITRRESLAGGAPNDAVMMSVHADWAIRDANGFRGALLGAAAAARRHSALVTVGIVPDRPDTGLGYIEPGDELSPGVRRVKRFVEKPDRDRVGAMLQSGCLWNSGIFVWRVSDFLDEIRAHTPEVSGSLEKARSIEDFFGAVRSISVDVGLLERSSKVLVVPGDFGWDDVGTWASLRRVRDLDASGNASSGSVFVYKSAGNVVHADGCDVVLYGVDDLVVVARPGLTLVTTVERATDLKQLVESLPESMREPR
ncbi:MAG: mannose-1-phosphate guanylyltransferase [Gemmatimonadota bacterium]